MPSGPQRVDKKSKLGPGENRKSVRIESAEPVEIGSLILADIVRMPWGCASEFVRQIVVLVGFGWPNSIIESGDSGVSR